MQAILSSPIEGLAPMLDRLSHLTQIVCEVGEERSRYDINVIGSCHRGVTLVDIEGMDDEA